MRSYSLIGLLLAIFFSSTAQAEDICWMCTEEVSVDGYRILDRRDPYQPDLTDKWSRGANVNLNLRALEYLNWQGRLHMDGTEDKLYNAGLEYTLVMDRWNVQPFYYHHSQHSLDSEGVGNYPLVNEVGLRFIFYKRGVK